MKKWIAKISYLLKKIFLCIVCSWSDVCVVFHMEFRGRKSKEPPMGGVVLLRGALLAVKVSVHLRIAGVVHPLRMVS